ncbi:MAG: SelT/SelW/SelH family protein [Chitinophagaceae bacterium]
MLEKKTIVIEYCPKCGWMLRAAYMAQELLTTFVEEIGGVTLVPSVVAGCYCISVDGVLLFDRKRDAHFPEITALKRAVRDIVAPGKNLGHSDHPNADAPPKA